MRSEQTGDHAVGWKPWSSGGDCEDVPKRERLRTGRKVWAHMWNAHHLPDLSLHRQSHNGLRSAVRHHRYAQVCFSPCTQLSSLCISLLYSFLFYFLSRSVEEEDRPFALGMQFVLLRTLGRIGQIWLNSSFFWLSNKAGPILNIHHVQYCFAAI